MVRDLGSLNGLFVGGRQVTETALHPNAEFTIGPLTFRVEYQYVGESVPEPDATTVTETHDAPQPAGEPGQGKLEVVDQPEVAAAGAGPGPDEQAPAFLEESAGEGPSQPVDVPPTIAPPDGELPDFSAWGAPEGGEEAQPGEKPLPSAAASSDLGPPAEESSPEEDEGQRPESAPSDDPAPTEYSTGAADEETRETAPPPAPEAEKATEEGMFDLSPSPLAPQAEETTEAGLFDLSPSPAAETEEPDDAGSGDKELDEFLKGLE
jgi:hypothetical protein